MRQKKCQPRRGAATVELAVLLPFLVFLFAIATDFSRVFHYSQVIENCALNGAFYAAGYSNAQSPYTSTEQAALADAGSLSPQPTVTSSTSSDASGNAYAAVTVSWQFEAVMSVPGVPSTTKLSRTVRMRVAPN